VATSIASRKEFATFCGVRHAITCTIGTAAVHLALLAFGLQPGDEVIVPTLTFVASANPVRYYGASDSIGTAWIRRSFGHR
jgi:perosamine synthetase